MAKIAKRGTGTWRNVTDVVIRVGTGSAFAGLSAVAATTTKTATVRLSGNAGRAAAIIAANAADHDAIVARAVHAANARGGCPRVWDVDIAAAMGCVMTPAAFAAWRAANGVPTGSVSWPGTPRHTPDAGYVCPGAPVPAAPDVDAG